MSSHVLLWLRRSRTFQSRNIFHAMKLNQWRLSFCHCDVQWTSLHRQCQVLCVLNPSRLSVLQSAPVSLSLSMLTICLCPVCRHCDAQLWHHGLHTNELHAICIATMVAARMVAKLSYASPAWWEYANTDDKVRLEAFLRHPLILRTHADSALFCKYLCWDWRQAVLYNEQHLLRTLLPSSCDNLNSLRSTTNHNL